MNEHFVIYESAMYDESFEKQIMNGDFSVEQLREKVKTISDEQFKILKENINFSGKYSKEVIEELSAPKQRGFFQALGQETLGRGTVKNSTNNKLIEVYKNVWKEYTQYVKKQQGLGNNVANSLKTAATLLGGMGIDPALLNSVKAAKFKRINVDKQVDNQTVGNFIYSVLQQHYQGSAATDHQANYQLPQSI